MSAMTVDERFGRALKALAGATSKDNSRPVLQCVHVELTGWGELSITATDSYKAVRYRCTSCSSEVDGCVGEAIISAADAKTMGDAICRCVRAQDRVAVLSVDNVDGELVLRAMDYSGREISRAYSSAFAFPHVDRFLHDAHTKRADGMSTGVFGAYLLAEVCKMPYDIYRRDTPPVRVSMGPEHSPALVQAKFADTDYCAVLMPVRESNAYASYDPAETLVPTVTASAAEPAGSKAVA